MSREVLNKQVALQAKVERVKNETENHYMASIDALQSRLTLQEKVVEAAKEVFKVKRPSYHDCLDDGMPECEWCLLEAALAELEKK